MRVACGVFLREESSRCSAAMSASTSPSQMCTHAMDFVCSQAEEGVEDQAQGKGGGREHDLQTSSWRIEGLCTSLSRSISEPNANVHARARDFAVCVGRRLPVQNTTASFSTTSEKMFLDSRGPRIGEIGTCVCPRDQSGVCCVGRLCCTPVGHTRVSWIATQVDVDSMRFLTAWCYLRHAVGAGWTRSTRTRRAYHAVAGALDVKRARRIR